VVIGIKVRIWGVIVALAFSVIGALFVIMSGYGELIFLIVLMWILIPVIMARLYHRIKESR
jgi:hypothetical protein